MIRGKGDWWRVSEILVVVGECEGVLGSGDRQCFNQRSGVMRVLVLEVGSSEGWG